MITLCTGCNARYRLDASKVPERLIKVRCPACSSVFDLDGTQHSTLSSSSPGASGLPTGVELPVSTEPVSLQTRPPLAESAQPLSETSPAEKFQRFEDAAPKNGQTGQGLQLESATAVLDRPGKLPAGADTASMGRRRRREKNEMLARALVSDILVYNQAARDKALAEGSLLEALGPEIKKSWELYKEKVGAAAATSTTHFKDALNEILAEGQQVF